MLLLLAQSIYMAARNRIFCGIWNKYLNFSIIEYYYNNYLSNSKNNSTIHHNNFKLAITMINPDLIGYAKAVYIVAIIECVMYCVSIVGLIFLYFPIVGMRIVKKWDLSDAKCVGLLYPL